jgi:hypothetical protein
MNRRIASALIGTAVVALGAGAGALVVTQDAAGAARTTAGQHLVMQASGDLVAGSGLFYLKLMNATSGFAKVTNRIAVSSITFAQLGGSQPVEVSIRAATCDNSNGFGALEYVVVPQNQTVHLSYPSAVRMPFVSNTPSSYCLYAETVRDGGTLDVTVVATTF